MDTPSRTRPDTSIFGAPPSVEAAISADALAAAAGISRAALERLVALDLLETTSPGSGEFSPAMAARLRRMVRIHASLGVNLMGAAIIVDLLERLDRLERR